MALMSLSWPPKVCLQVPSLMSHSLAVKSQAPEMKNLKSGDTPRDMQSPWCPANTVFWVPVSMSHSTLERQVWFNLKCKRINSSFLLFSKSNYILTKCSRLSWWWSQCRWGNDSRTGNLYNHRNTTWGTAGLITKERLISVSCHLPTCVRCQLSHDLDIPILAFQVVDGAHVVQTATRHKVSRRCVGTGHHPRWLEGDGIHLGLHRGQESLFSASEFTVVYLVVSRWKFRSCNF